MISAPLTFGHTRGGGATLDHGIGAIDIINCEFRSNYADAPDEEGSAGAAFQTGLPAMPGECGPPCVDAEGVECGELCIPSSCSSMMCDDCCTNVTVTNTLVVGNHGRGLAGGAIRTNRMTTFNNCVIVANHTQTNDGGGVFIGHEASATFDNCIIRHNTVCDDCTVFSLLERQVSNPFNPIRLRHCNIEGWGGSPVSTIIDPASTANFDAPADFFDVAEGPDTEWGTVDDVLANFRLLPTSPCIDAGLNALLPADTADIDEISSTTILPFDLRYETRTRDGTCGGGDPVVDMGAHEYWCFGDLNGDCVISGFDSAIVLNAWMTTGYFPCPQHEPADLDRDCDVDGFDLALVFGGWGDCPEVGGGEGAAPFGAGEESAEDEVFAMLYQWYLDENWDALLEWALSQLP